MENGPQPGKLFCLWGKISYWGVLYYADSLCMKISAVFYIEGPLYLFCDA